MLLGIVSDTHGHVQNAQSAARMLTSLEVDEVVHCGDIGTPRIVEIFAPWPTHFVLGNVDGAELESVIVAAGQNYYGEFGHIERLGRTIAFMHSHDTRRFRAEIGSGRWDVVCYGHTHRAEQHREGSTLVLNPGALYRANAHTLAILRLPELEVTPIVVSRPDE